MTTSTFQKADRRRTEICTSKAPGAKFNTDLMFWS